MRIVKNKQNIAILWHHVKMHENASSTVTPAAYDRKCNQFIVSIKLSSFSSQASDNNRNP